MQSLMKEFFYDTHHRVRHIGFSKNRMSIVKELVHVAFDKTNSQKTDKGSLFSLDVSGIITEELVKDNTPK